MSVGVVLMTYGAPRDRDDLPRYLSAVRGGKAPEHELVDEMWRRYLLIGGSPLVEITAAQAAGLEKELGEGWVAAPGMRYSPPTIGEAVADVVRRGAARIVGIVLSPQWSPALMGGYTRQIDEAVRGLDRPMPVAVAGSWHREPAFIAMLAGALRTARAAHPEAAVLLTAHSLPKRVFDHEPEYVAQLRETATLVAARAGVRTGEWQWAYQSAGHTREEWLRPDLKELFPALAAAGRRSVLVAPVQFLSDHLEVLYDLDVAAAGEARAAGLEYLRVEMPNANAPMVRTLAAVARDTAGILPPQGDTLCVAGGGSRVSRNLRLHG